ncbi:MAG: DUF4250 domain-containing protein [Lachnospiraceae bacterium]|jgi:hypothetical protein
MAIPKDPIMLLSYINTQLRDNYPTLEELCSNLNAEQNQLEEKLAAIGYCYDAAGNQFK